MHRYQELTLQSTEQYRAPSHQIRRWQFRQLGSGMGPGGRVNMRINRIQFPPSGVRGCRTYRTLSISSQLHPAGKSSTTARCPQIDPNCKKKKRRQIKARTQEGQLSSM
ncbi:hypothetical protein GUJ93_ZPchr0005g14897 [Zizania palustris]|uniref:Uncharacterized protein n=1 Tax=Zizania palustris TaxID=103762 RepID=A0A8J5SGP6_ZIZPA|nr:hypothetical protein GUJ93_ZPchr0005g14897 [Zizania palustris]